MKQSDKKILSDKVKTFTSRLEAEHDAMTSKLSDLIASNPDDVKLKRLADVFLHYRNRDALLRRVLATILERIDPDGQ